MPTRANTHADAAISQMMIRRMANSQDFISDKILPTVLVNRASDKYYKFNNSHLRIESTALDSRGGANEVDFDFQSASYSIDDYGLKHFIHGKLLRNADPVIKRNLKIAAARTVTDLLLLDKEKRAANLLFNSNTFSGRTAALNSPEKWDVEDSKPFDKIAVACDTVLKNCGKLPNTIIMGYEVWSKLRNHPEFIKRLPDTSVKKVTPSSFKEFLNDENMKIENVLIGNQTYNDAPEGQDDEFSFIWGKYFLIAYVNYDALTVMDQTLGKTFMENSLNGLQVKYFRESEDEDGEWCKGTISYDLVLVDPNCGFLYSGVVS